MPLVSLQYLGFLLAIVILYYLLPRYQRLLLTAASLVFLGLGNLASGIAIIVLSLFNFQTGLSLFSAGREKRKTRIFIIAVLVNCLVILLFKYFESTPLGFYVKISSINYRLNHLVFLLGISFYSLQNIAYLTDVYQRRMNPVTSLPDFILYNAFFPKVFAGPIVLPGEFFNRGTQAIRFNSSNIAEGTQRILLGLVKKVVIADRLAPTAHSIFDFNESHPGATSLAAAYVFTVQLYFDFSGYTDMAIGACMLFGIPIKENFNLPFLARSVSEFWRRWHISLIDWLTKYLYYPVVFRLRNWKKWAAATGICITFIISGVWHGIGWTFLCWSICHMVFLLVELFTKMPRLRLAKKFSSFPYRAASILITFNLVSLSNIFFRATRIGDALRLFRQIFSGPFLPVKFLADFMAPLAIGGNREELFNYAVTITLTAAILFSEGFLYRYIRGERVKFGFILISLLLILYFGVLGHAEKFIYTQF
ncbi:MAG TPA: MBOAT family O-acyltransferase [Chitinophagaceae bacterium]|nr:MBOAT family O-acyltransferase [Chitinophagaceae bacterium]